MEPNNLVLGDIKEVESVLNCVLSQVCDASVKTPLIPKDLNGDELYKGVSISNIEFVSLNNVGQNTETEKSNKIDAGSVTEVRDTEDFYGRNLSVNELDDKEVMADCQCIINSILDAIDTGLNVRDEIDSTLQASYCLHGFDSRSVKTTKEFVETKERPAGKPAPVTALSFDCLTSGNTARLAELQSSVDKESYCELLNTSLRSNRGKFSKELDDCFDSSDDESLPGSPVDPFGDHSSSDEVSRLLEVSFSDDQCPVSPEPKKHFVKSKSQPVLKIVDFVQQSTKPASPPTPECSENFADLNLGIRNGPVASNTSFSASVPVGWINTVARRKQRNYSTLSKEEMKRDDFVYCGPEKKNTEQTKGAFETSFNPCLKLRTPEQASEISLDLVYSNVAVLPGATDKNNQSLLIVFADEIVWQKCNVGTIALTRYLLYLTSRVHDVCLLIDERGASDTSASAILEALHIYQNNSPERIKKVLILSDATSLLHPNVKNLFNVECEVVSSDSELEEFIDSKNLLVQLGGELQFSQAEWIQNRLVVDSFLHFCENVRHNFARHGLSMTSQSLSDSATETRMQLSQHHKDMTQLLDDRQVSNLRDRGQRILQQLSQDGTTDAWSCAELVQSSYSAANEAVTRFVQIADDRLLSLERHLLVKEFEKSCDYILDWCSENSHALQQRFSVVADSIEDLILQRQEFDEFYFSAMKEYAKCDCLLTEAHNLNKLGYLTEPQHVQRTKIAEEELRTIVDIMEKKKQEVEATSQMYKFIDQAYSWALSGMKFMALLNMEDCLTLDACQKMLDKFDDYMKEHPPISKEQFSEMLQLATRYGNVKCLRQCEFAQQKYEETTQLFAKRRELIAKAKAQIKSSTKKRSTSFRMKNREKLDKAAQAQGRPDDVEGERSSSESSERRISLNSMESRTSFENMSETSCTDSALDDTSGVFVSDEKETPNSSFSVTPTKPHHPKLQPARKMLKKSQSMTSHPTRPLLTHHMHSQSGTTLTIGSPVQIKEPDTTGKSKVALIIEELISTEQEYVKSLNYVIENYFPEMCRLDIPQALRCKRNVIFGNIEKIAEFHSGYFLDDLEKCSGSPSQVAKVFQVHRDSFGLYALYSKNKPLSDELLQEHGNEFFKAKQLQLKDKMDLASYLLKPVQRMGKYALLLHAMAKRATGSEERSLKEAEEMVKFQLRHGNDLLTMSSIQECDVNLKEQGNLLRQEQFVINAGRKKYVRRVFLFEDLVLFSKPIHVHGGHDIYQYKCSYKTAEIGITENIGDSGFKFEIWFRRRRSQASQDRFVLQSSTKAIKRSWVEEIRGMLWKQALRNRDNRKMEMTVMGVGSKPHLDLVGSSVNRITDRSVLPSTVDLSERLSRSRTRASIAVSSFDHSSTSKRPHSTISTSSSTSSVGSGGNQSGSIVSSLNLAHSWTSREGDSYSRLAGLNPPMAYCDFHAIAEDENEEYSETTSEGPSSVCNSTETTTEEASDSLTSPARQYVTTHDPSLQSDRLMVA
ncbi:puratrophin-1 isoform X1 [Ciona intestinalis]